MDTVKEILGEDFGERVLDMIQSLAEGLGVAAEFVFTAMIKQQLAYGIATMFFGIILIAVICIFLIKLIPNWFKKYDNSKFELGVLFVACIIASTLILWYCVLEGFMHVFNPEYYAIKEIVDMVNGGVK